MNLYQKIKNSIIMSNPHIKDWLFGYNNPVEKIKFTANWWPYKPTDETQRLSKFDPWDCTSRAKCNIIEFILDYKITHNLLSSKAIKFLNGDNCLKVSYFDENGKINFLDKYSAILSGTIPGKGNTFKKPAEVIRKYGLVPEQLLKDIDIDKLSKDEYYAKKSIEAFIPLGKEFLEIFDLNYEIVYEKDFRKAILYSPIECGVYAWRFRDGRYVSDGKVNHDAVIANISQSFEIFDSYSPFIKHLAPDYKFMFFGYIWFIADKTKSMTLKDKCRYVCINKTKGKKEYAFSKAGKLIVGGRDEILNLFIDETGGDIKGKVITVSEENFYSVPHYNIKLEKVKD